MIPLDGDTSAAPSGRLVIDQTIAKSVTAFDTIPITLSSFYCISSHFLLFYLSTCHGPGRKWVAIDVEGLSPSIFSERAVCKNVRLKSHAKKLESAFSQPGVTPF